MWLKKKFLEWLKLVNLVVGLDIRFGIKFLIYVYLKVYIICM